MKFRIVYNAWWMKKGYAMVVWPWMWINKSEKDFKTWHYRHELEHCYQVKRMGRFKFYLTYLWYLIWKGYTNHPYEIAARKVQDTPLTSLEEEWRINKRISI